MEIAILLSLLGMGLAAGMGGSDNSDEAETVEASTDEDTLPTEDPDRAEEPRVVGQDLTLDGAGTITGTEGDDRIEVTGFSEITREVFGGDGNDTLIANDYSRLEGGAGDDVLILDDKADFHPAVAYGGEGDDTFSGTQAQGMYGEAGDDTINVRHLSNYNGLGITSGGAGDDEINIALGLGENFGGAQESLFVEGNEGSDTFTLDLTLVEREGREEDGGYYRTGLEITDFNPDEDHLIVDVTPEMGQEDSTYEAHLVEGSENVYLLVLTVIEDDIPEGARQRVTDFTIRTTGPVTLDDISFVGSVPLSA